MIILFIYCFFSSIWNQLMTNDSLESHLLVKGKGILPVSKRDIGLSFYVDVENESEEELSLSTKMMFCCELITEDDNDCTHMHLVGGQMGDLLPNQTRTVTLIYITLYPYNRKGRCVVAIYFKGPKSQCGAIKTEIMFDTIVSFEPVPPPLQNFYDPNKITLCDSPDLDPLKDCKPVNCHWKYSGKRSFFSSTRQRCERVPECKTSPDKELPDIVYVPNINTCKNLEEPISEEDVKHLARSEQENTRFTDPDIPMITNIDCHHGVIDENTKFCICDPGWTSVYPEGEDYEPSTLPYHMCTIEIPVESDLNNNVKSPLSSTITTVIGLVTAIMVILFSIITHECWILQEKRYSSQQKNKKNRVKFSMNRNTTRLY